MKKKILIIIGIVIVGVVALIFFGDPSSVEDNDFITANPLDLTQIKAISKFRSCEGHDYSGKNMDGETETNRSMKNYIEAISFFDKTTNQVKAFAPFDGKIVSVDVEENPRGMQVGLSPTDGGNWRFVYFHIDLLADISDGTKVSAGELIGYADLTDSANFDMVLKRTGGFSRKYASVFDYMEESVIQQYEAVGLTADNIVVTKDVRDANPCDFSHSANADGWITLQ